MTSQPLEQPRPPTPVNLNITIVPLLTDAQHALRHDADKYIDKIKLQKLEGARDNDLNDKIVKEADNLLNPRLPQDTNGTGVVLEITFTDSPEPELVEIRPPNTIRYKFSRHAYAILAWLCRSPLNASGNLLGLVLAVLLTIAFAGAPAFDDNDGDDDDDDCDGDRIIHCARPSTTAGYRLPITGHWITGC